MNRYSGMPEHPWEAKEHEAIRFLLLRLAEVYSASFGRAAPLHDTKRAAVTDHAPDQVFAGFVRASLKVFNWPSSETCIDYHLRALKGIERAGIKFRLDWLADAVGPLISYSSLPSIGWLIDLGAYQGDEL